MERWSAERARTWWENHKWPVGFNYVTSDAVNDIEMWMDSTFNASLIEEELKLAAETGFNSARVFLSYAVWLNEGERFLENFETFLTLAGRAGITVMPILFDDCAFDFGSEPQYGPQSDPVPGVHNSRWVPSPGFLIQDDPAQEASLEAYVRAVVGSHRDDERILVWDLYNEPGNTGRRDKALPLLKKAFEWSRACQPVQPLTAGMCGCENNDAVDSLCLEQSDLISFHAYGSLEHACGLIDRFKPFGRPLLITEWMHRPNGSTIKTHLPLFHREKIGAWQWGMIVGKTQTNLDWSTMNGGTPDPNPVLWQHDILHPDGTPYDPEETALIAKLAGKNAQ